MKRKDWIAIGTATVVVVAAVWLLRRPLTFEQAGTRLVDCAIAGDAGCLYAYTSPWEREALELDAGKMRSFVEGWYLPKFRAKAEGAAQFAGNPANVSELSVSRTVSLKSGAEATVDMQIAKEDSGYFSPYLVAQLWLTAVLYTARAEGKDVRGPARQALLAEAARTEGPRIEALGIKGLIMDRATGFQTWAELASRFDSRASTLRERLAEASSLNRSGGAPKAQDR